MSMLEYARGKNGEEKSICGDVPEGKHAASYGAG